MICHVTHQNGNDYLPLTIMNVCNKFRSIYDPFIATNVQKSFICYITSFSCLSLSDIGKHSLNSKHIPQIKSTKYLALIRRFRSTKIHSQTFSVVIEEATPIFLMAACCGTVKNTFKTAPAFLRPAD